MSSIASFKEYNYPKNEEEKDEWALFQNEKDSVRDVVLMYKTKECNITECNNNDCFFFHKPNERRRKPFNKKGKLVYTSDICIEGEQCKNIEMTCSKSHNFYEINYHPWKFKTKPCELYPVSSTTNKLIPNTNNNHNEKLCPYYHSCDQKRVKSKKNNNVCNQNNINKNNLIQDYTNQNETYLNNNNNNNFKNENLNNNINNKIAQNFNTGVDFNTSKNNSFISTQSIYNNKLNQHRGSKESVMSLNELNNMNHSFNKNNFNMSSYNSNSQKFDLIVYKVFKCVITTKHSEKQCIYFHSSKDRRRSQNQFYYTSEICDLIQSDYRCQLGDYCNKSHNQVEMFYHKDKFKTKFCSHYYENKDLKDINSDCPYGSFCSFAHLEKEIRIELIHKYPKTLDFFIYKFKTVVCPFDQKHDKSSCEYSHNLQDFRRNPKKYIYEKKNCSKWDNKKTILIYSDGCPDGYLCNYCHGWKELDFHPLSYKTTKCKNYRGNCEKGILCPFYHNFENKR
jgi:hypothetical protein